MFALSLALLHFAPAFTQVMWKIHNYEESLMIMCVLQGSQGEDNGIHRLQHAIKNPKSNCTPAFSL